MIEWFLNLFPAHRWLKEQLIQQFKQKEVVVSLLCTQLEAQRKARVNLERQLSKANQEQKRLKATAYKLRRSLRLAKENATDWHKHANSAARDVIMLMDGNKRLSLLLKKYGGALEIPEINIKTPVE